MPEDVPPKLSEVEVEKLKTLYPSVDLAYQIAVDSYDALVKRVDSIDGRLQTVLALFAGVTATVPVLGAGRGLSFRSLWFYIALASMVVAVLVTVHARLAGKIQLLDPNKLNTDEWLRRSEWEFKNFIVQAACLAFTENNKLIARKWAYIVIVTITFFLGGVSLALWALRF